MVIQYTLNAIKKIFELLFNVALYFIKVIPVIILIIIWAARDQDLGDKIKNYFSWIKF